jgi:diguanylate cyclase
VAPQRLHQLDREHSGSLRERVSSLFATRMPATIMSVLFAAVGGVTAAATRDVWIALTFVCGTMVSCLRLSILFAGRRLFADRMPTIDEVRELERRFGAAYIGFAVIFGAFAARALSLPAEDLHLPVAILVVGYAAGAVATAALRPKIAVPSVLMAVVPSVAVLACTATDANILSALCLSALLAGGLRSSARRYEVQAEQSAITNGSADLARTDHLTGLLNRFAFDEAVLQIEGGSLGGAQYAVHYLDLDGFKQVNDVLGHSTGDVLLSAVGERLRGSSLKGDVVARVGGDEFVVVQVDAGPASSKRC